MKQTVTLNINDITVLQLLRSLASMKLVEITSEFPSQSNLGCNDLITAHLNEVYKNVDSSLDPDLVRVQAEVLRNSTAPGVDW